MALSANTVWEVRPGSGTDTNGGGFVTGASGTDFSQQNSKNSGGNNGSVTDGVGNGTTTFTSATASFTTAIVGNIVYITGTGLTTGWYQVASYTNGTTIVLDRSPGTGTGGTLNIGGSLATIAQSVTNTTVGGMTTYVKATGTYTTTSAVTFSLSTSFIPFVSFIGYTTTRGDNGKVTWTTSTNSIKLITDSGGGTSGVMFANINWTCTAGTPGDCFHAQSGPSYALHLRNCIISGFNIGINGYFAVDYNYPNLLIENTEIKGCVSHGIQNTGTTTVLGSTIHNNGGSGIYMYNNNSYGNILTCAFTAVKANTSHGIYYANSNPIGPTTLINCDIVNNGGSGVLLDSGNPNYSQPIIWNSIIYGNTANGVKITSNGPFVMAFKTNAYGSNTSGNYSGINVVADPTDVTLTADPFTGRTSTPPDLSLNSTTGGGPLCTGTGTPATLPFS